MSATFSSELPAPGFSFENVKRNTFLLSNGSVSLPKATKTGTTICGAIFKDGVVVGADTRSTGGEIVADKNCMKIHPLAPNMVVCGAGTAADCNKITAMIESQLELLRLDWNRQVKVCTAQRLFKNMLFRYQGHIGAYLIIGGVDFDGPQLYSIAAHGSTDKIPFTAMGSGMLSATSILELGWKPDMSEEECKKLVRDAIAAGITHDMGSGSNIDLAVIKAGDKIDYLRPYEELMKSGTRRQDYVYPAGTTPVINVSIKDLEIVSETVREIPMEQ